jgi:hypothetical protein
VEHLARAVALAPEIRTLLPGFVEFAGLLDDPRLADGDDPEAQPARGRSS